jgi:hypothetical protein
MHGSNEKYIGLWHTLAIQRTYMRVPRCIMPFYLLYSYTCIKLSYPAMVLPCSTVLRAGELWHRDTQRKRLRYTGGLRLSVQIFEDARKCNAPQSCHRQPKPRWHPIEWEGYRLWHIITEDSVSTHYCVSWWFPILHRYHARACLAIFLLHFYDKYITRLSLPNDPHVLDI